MYKIPKFKLMKDGKRIDKRILSISLYDGVVTFTNLKDKVGYISIIPTRDNDYAELKVVT